MNHSLPTLIATWTIWAGITPAAADWRDEIGFTRLQLLAGAELPLAPSQGLAQVEAGADFEPDTASSLFTGKTFTHKSGSSGVSGHAHAVANFFYSSTSQIPGTCGVDLYSANGWLNANFLRFGTTNAPLVEPRAIQNHSWIGEISASLTTSQASEICRRLDFAIHRDGFISVVGVNNSSSNALPAILCQSYNTISVGRADGDHSSGLTTIDGANRMKPDIVAPESATSWATPIVAGTAGMLHSKLFTNYAITGANLPRVVKALLLATATKDTVPGWDNTSSTPLDSVYGAGEINACLAYTTLRTGRATASASTQHKLRGWAAEAVTSSSPKTYYFNIPAGAPSTPFCAALTWHRTVGGSWTTLTTSTLRNLSLRFYQASGFTLGSQIAASTSAVDNVELIYQSTMPPGNYALRVENATNNSTEYALAWHSLPTVSVAATVSTAREIDGQTGLITFNRTGDTTLPLLVPVAVSGSAVSGAHFQPLPGSVTFPTGQSTVTLQIIPISDSLAQGSRSVIVAAGADFASVRDTSQTATVTIEDKPADAWRHANFSPAELSDNSISGDTADPDGDNLANLIEYALGLPPKIPDISPVSFIELTGYQALSATKNPAATDILWGAQVAGDLSSWSVATVVTDNSATFTARDNVLKTSATRRCIRLKITRP